MRRLETIQALRGIAALLVLLFHCANIQYRMVPQTDLAEQAILTGFWSQGYAGVDLFFVISGFIMVYVTQDRDPDLRGSAHFLFDRATRIYPLWWVYAGLMILYFLITYGSPAAPDVATGTEVAPHILKSLLLLPQDSLPVLGLGWTLIHEMFFYLVFAGLLLLSRRFLPLYLIIWAGVCLAVSLIIAPPRHAEGLISLATSPLTLEFIGGSLAGWLFLRRRAAKGLWVMLALGAGLWIIALSRDWTDEAWPLIFYRVAAFGAPGVLLIYALVNLEWAGKIRTPRFLAALGDWSYSLYLSHMLVLLALRKIWIAAGGALPAPLQFLAPGWLDNLAFALTGCAAAIIFSAISYRFIERPLLKAARKVWPG